MAFDITRRSALALGALGAVGGTFGLGTLLGNPAFAAGTAQLVIMQSEPPRSMDAADHTATYTGSVLESMYESLTGYDEQLEIIPELSTEWDQNASGTEWTFRLREGVVFHDGTPFNAAAVVASFGRHLDEARGLASSGRLRAIIERVTAVDEGTVTFTLKNPYPAFLRLLAGNASAIVSPTADAAGDLGRHAVGTGRYRFVEWKSGEYVLCERNPDYWGTPGGADTLKWTWTQESAVMNMSIQTGDADIVVPLPPVFAPSVGSNPELTLIEAEGAAVFWVALNVQLKPLDDVRVRQAINLATDRAGLVSNLLYGYGTAATSPLSPVCFGYDPSIEGYAYDIEKAKALLAEAGYADGITINVAVQEPEANIAEILQGMWANAGITLNIQRMESGVWSAAVFGDPEQKAAQEVHSVIASWSTGTFDADLQLRPLYYTGSFSPTGANLGFFSNPRLDEIIEQAGSTTDQDLRRTLYAEAQRIIVDEAAHVLLYYPKDLIAVRADVKGVWQIPGGLVVPVSAVKA